MTPELKAKYLDLDRAIGHFVELLQEPLSDQAKSALADMDKASESLQEEIWK